MAYEFKTLASIGSINNYIIPDDVLIECAKNVKKLTSAVNNVNNMCPGKDRYESRGYNGYTLSFLDYTKKFPDIVFYFFTISCSDYIYWLIMRNGLCFKPEDLKFNSTIFRYDPKYIIPNNGLQFDFEKYALDRISENAEFVYTQMKKINTVNIDSIDISSSLQ